MKRPVNPSQIAKEFDAIEALEARGTAKTVDFTVEVCHRNVSLFNYDESTHLLEITSPVDLIADVEEAIDRCGLYDLEVEFMPSVRSGIKSSNGMLKTMNGFIKQKNRTNEGFKLWLETICSSIANKVYFIPDTNFLMRQYYSGYLREILSRNKTSMFMRIPRLGILEVENKYNKNKHSRPKGNPNEQDKLRQKIEQENKAKERRKAFQTMSEILCIEHDGGDILQHFDMSLLQTFSDNAERYADAWIRREITNNLGKLRGSAIVGKDNAYESWAEIFLTCDFMAALVAVAENINTLYFYRVGNGDNKLKPTHDELALLIVNTAIQLNECKCIIRNQRGIITKGYCGMWSGKSAFEWENNIVREWQK